MWIGLTIPAVVHTMNGLHQHYPFIPDIPIIWNLNQFLPGKPWTDMTVIFLTFAFSVIGISFLLPRDVCFSIPFFLLFSRLQEVIASLLGRRLAIRQAAPRCSPTHRPSGARCLRSLAWSPGRPSPG